MKFVFFVLCVSCLSGVVAQNKPLYNTFYQLDSISHSNSIAKHFAGLYHAFLKSIESQVVTADTATQRLVRRFEQVFAQFYVDACHAHLHQREIKITDWQAYFSQNDLQPIQYKLLGANAHLNGGLWQALTSAFTKQEMDQLHKQFLIFNHTLNKIYRQVYKEGEQHNKKLSRLAMFSLGLDQLIGNYYLYKWRKRQMRIAKLFWNASTRLPAVSQRVLIRKNFIDRLIIKTL